MCGRFTLTEPAPWLAEILGPGAESAGALEEIPPRYNAAPGTEIHIVRASEETPRELARARWGLVPHWARSPDFAARTINARAETAAEKPAFRAAFRRRRCLVPADGFYEWAGDSGKKRPWFIRLSGGRPFAFAGLWESWRGADGARLDTCAILTTEANERLAALHPRMPVILPESAHGAWLDPKAGRAPAALRALLKPWPAEDCACHPVGERVNSPGNDDPACLERRGAEAAPPPRQGSLFGD